MFGKENLNAGRAVKAIATGLALTAMAAEALPAQAQNYQRLPTYRQIVRGTHVLDEPNVWESFAAGARLQSDYGNRYFSASIGRIRNDVVRACSHVNEHPEDFSYEDGRLQQDVISEGENIGQARMDAIINNLDLSICLPADGGGKK